METIFVSNLELDASTKEFIQDCLSTPEILRQILEQFSDSELLRLSLVNEQWNFEARSVLKGRGNLTARLSGQCSCQSLVVFASDLEKMRVVPFSGVNVVVSHPHGFQSPSNVSLDSFYNMILDRLPCKHLSVSFINTYWNNCKDCRALVLVKRIMEVYCGAIETFSLTLESDGYEEMFEQVFHQHWDFPHLKTFKIKSDTPDDGGLTNFAKALVSRAPNLKELNFDGAILFEENVLNESTAMLVPAYEFCPAFEVVCESMMRSVRAEKIAILVPFEGFNMDFLSRAVPMLLEASRTTLTSLRMDVLSTVPLICYGICLENVTKLEICMRSESLRRIQPAILPLIKGFDFTGIFPKLEHVKIAEAEHGELAFEPHHISGFVEQGNALLRNTVSDRATNIKHLTLLQFCWKSTSPFWAQMFPNVVTFSMDIGKPCPLPFQILWEQFLNLEELIVKSVHWASPMLVNLDSVFCGIFPEEVAELEGKDDEYLRAVNIVPVMPSLRCTTGLKSFMLDLDHTLPYIRGGRWDTMAEGNYLFSKVTALIGFARCPALAVTFVTNSLAAKAMNHMKPYVCFVAKGSADPGIQTTLGD